MADEMSELVTFYTLLGECFEATDAADMFGRGYLMEVPSTFSRAKHERLPQGRRELQSAMKLARVQGLTGGVYRLAHSSFLSPDSA